MAETEVKMPQMGESIFEGTVTKWLKKNSLIVFERGRKARGYVHSKEGWTRHQKEGPVPKRRGRGGRSQTMFRNASLQRYV